MAQSQPVPNSAPSAPSIVETSSSSVGAVSVSWIPSTDDTTPAASIRYQVHAALAPGFVASVDTLKFDGVGVAAATVSTGLTPGARYYFRVVATDQANATANSAEMSVFVADTTATLVPGVRTISLAPEQVAAVTADTVQLRAGTTPPSVGQFIASAEGSGFLRAVTGVNGTTLQTRPAALNEVISDVRFGSSVALPAFSTGTSTQILGSAGTLTAATSARGSELHWPAHGLRLLNSSPPPTAGSSQRILSAAPQKSDFVAPQSIGNRSSIDVSPQFADSNGRFATVLAPSLVGILTGARDGFDINVRIDRDDKTFFGLQRIPLALCDVRLSENDLPANIAVGSLTATSTEILANLGNYEAMRAGRARISVNATGLAARSEPYRLKVRLYVGEASKKCSEARGWAEELDVEVRVIVATTPNFPRGESKLLDFKGGFSVKNATNYTFDPILESEFDLSLRRPRSARVAVKGRAELSQILTVTATGAARLDQTVELIEKREFIKVFFAGPVPVVVVGTFIVDMRLEGEVTGAMTASETLSYSLEDISASVRYENGQWLTSAAARPVQTLKLTGEANAQARLTLTLLPRLSVSVYDVATARLVLAPFVEAQAGIQGSVQAQFADGTSLLDADAWLDKAEVAVGMDAFLMADLGMFDKTFLTWPEAANPNDYRSFHRLAGVIPRTLIVGIPKLTATADFAARHPTEPYAVLFRGQAVDVPNPFLPVWGPASFLPFRTWFDPKVVAVNGSGYGLLDRLPGDASGDFWIRFTKPGSYKVRLSGHSAMGPWARQISDVSIQLTDTNGNGVPDELEVRDPVFAVGVDFASCTAPEVGSVMTCTLTGKNLPTSSRFSATNCSPSPMQAVAGGTTTARVFTCTPQSSGVSVVVSYTVPGFGGQLPNVPTLAATLPVGIASFVATGSMRDTRVGHTATRLNDGRVLVTGGDSSANTASYLRSAEIYSPSSGSFTPTRDMLSPRGGHTATLLRDGRVLITGGLSEYVTNRTLSSAEIYDPQTGEFRATGGMKAKRVWHTAVPLDDGRVLIAGGFDNQIPVFGTYLKSAEVFDPSTGTFTLIKDMSVPRIWFSATKLLNGKVLIAAGSDGYDRWTNVAEVFDPSSLSFAPVGRLATPRWITQTAVLANGQVLFPGGNVPGDVGTRSTEVYSPLTESFALTGDMTSVRGGASVTVLRNGNVLVAGGFDAPRFLTTAELYDSQTGSFGRVAGPMLSARYNNSATMLVDGRVLLVGGLGTAAQALSTAEIYSDTQPGLRSSLFDEFDGLSANNLLWTETVASIWPESKVTVQGGSVFFGAGSRLDTFGKSHLCGSKIVVEAVMGQRETGITLLDIGNLDPVSRWGTNFISMSNTAYRGWGLHLNTGANGSRYAPMRAPLTGGTFEVAEQTIVARTGRHLTAMLAYRLTLEGSAITVERGTSFTSLTERMSTSLANTTTGRSFALVLSTGAREYSPGQFDLVRASTEGPCRNP